MTLAKLVAFVDDIPYCGTTPPRPPRPGQLDHLFQEVSLNPQPIPPGSEIDAYLWQSVQLYQLGATLAGTKSAATGELLTKNAIAIFEDWCGTVPIRVLLDLLRRRPPPPPPPWLNIISSAVGTVLVAGRIGGDLGKQLEAGATTLIKSQFTQAQAATKAA